MQQTTEHTVPAAPGRQVYWLIPVQWLVHYADEWAFGFPAWCTRHFEPLPGSLWVPMMAVGSVPMILLGWAASRPSAGPGVRLVCAGLQMLFCANGVFHLTTTLAFGEYSPGAGSGVLYVLLSPLLWRVAWRDPAIGRGRFATALTVGFVVHGLVLLSLLVDKSGLAPR